MTVAAPQAVETRQGPRAAVLWTAMVIVYLVWGSTYLAIRVSVHTMPPLFSAGVRFVVAGVLLGGVLAARSGWRTLLVSRAELAASCLVGVLLLFGGNGMVVLAERTVPSGFAALLVAAVPLWVVTLRALFADRPRLTTVGGVVIGFCGLVVLVLPGAGHGGGVAIGGALTVLGGSLSWAVGSFGSSRLPMPANPFVASVYEMVIGGAACLVAGIAHGESRDIRLSHIAVSSWVALGYLVVFGSLVAFTAYIWLLGNAPISLVSTYAYVNPVVAVALGALMLGERVTVAVLAGGAIVVLGVCVVVTTERRRAVAARADPPGRITGEAD